MKILLLYYTQHWNRPLTVNINLIWAAGTTDALVYDKAITLFI